MSKLGFIIDKIAVELNVDNNRVFHDDNILNLITDYMNNPQVSYEETLDKIKLYLI